MRRSFVTDARRERVIEPWAVAVMATVIVALLVLAFPDRSAVQRSDYARAGDVASLAYLRVLARAYPRDRSVQLDLVRELLAAGELAEARAHLRRWLEPLETASTRALVLGVEVTAGLLFERRAPPPERGRLRAQLARRMRALLQRPLERDRLRELAGWASAVAEHTLAGRLYARAAALGPAVSRDDLMASARAFRTGGAVARASAQYRRAFDLADDRRARALAGDWVALWLAAGRPRRALEVHRRVVERFPRDAALLARGIELARAAQQPQLALAWARRRVALQGSRPSSDGLRQVYRLERAYGRDAAAVATARRLLARGDGGPQLRAELARLLEATGRPREALVHWQWLVEHAPGRVRGRDVLALARATYSFDTALTLLAGRARERPLDTAELATLRAVARETAQPERALRLLRGLIEREPGRVRYWDLYLELVAAHGDAATVATAHRRYAERFPLGPVGRRRWARALIAQDRPRAALAALAPPEPPRRAGVAFWALRADLAWRLEALAPAWAAYAHLEARGRLATHQARRYVRLARRLGPPAHAARVALAAAEATRDPRLVVLGLEAASAGDDAAAGAALVRLGRDIAADEPRFWALAARHWQTRGNHARAAAAYRRGLAAAPGSGPLRAAYLWFLLERGREREALERVRAWSVAPDAGGELAGAVAVVYARNERTRAALAWYGRAAPVRSRDWLWLLSYAETLERAGRGGSAYRLRRHVLSALAEGRGTSERAAWRAEQALGRSRAARRRIADALGRPEAGAFWYRALASWYLEHEHLAGARAVLLRAHRRRLELPAWQRLSVALRQGDRHRVARLLRAHSIASPVTRAQALARTGDSGRALATAAAALPREVDDPAGLRSQMVELSNRRPHGARISGQAQDFGRVRLSGVAATYSRPVGDWQLDLATAHWDVVDPGIVAGADGTAIRAVSLEAEHRGPSGRWTVGLAHERRAGVGLTGASLRRRQRITADLAGFAGLGWREVPDLSGPLRLLGRRDRALVGLEGALTERTSWSVTGRWRRYGARAGGDLLATGVGLSAQASRRLALGDPDWTLRAALDWERYRRADTLPPPVARQVDGGTTVTALLPRRSATATVASRWSHGRPGRLRGRAASPRYALRVAAGWREPQGEPVVALSGGLGWRLTGADELALRGRWGRGADPVAAETRARVELSYTRWWGP